MNDEHSQSNEAAKEDINTLVNDKSAPIRLYQPKLLRIKEIEDQKRIIPNLTAEYQKENKKLRNKLSELNEMEKQLKEEQHDIELQRNLKSFYRNPFSYMDYLVKQYFREKCNLLENLDVKKQITNDFATFCHEIQGKLDTFTQGELQRLKGLERRIEDKMNVASGRNGGSGPHQQFDPNQPLSSQPIDQYTLSNAFFSNSNVDQSAQDNNSNKMKQLFNMLTRPASTQMILNDKAATLHQESIFKHSLACLKGDKIAPPKQAFLASGNLSLEEIQKKDMVDSKRITTIKKKAEWEEYIQAQLDPKYTYTDDPIKTRTKKQKSQEKVLFHKVLSQSSKGIDQMNKQNKKNEQMIDYIKTKLDDKFNKELVKVGLTKLSLYETNLNEIKDDLNKAKTNQYCVNLKERLKMMENEYAKTQKKIACVIGDQTYPSHSNHELPDDDIDKLYSKYASNKSKKATKSKGKPLKKSKVKVNPKKAY